MSAPAAAAPAAERSMAPAHVAFMLFIQALWGGNIILSKFALEEVPPFAFTGARFAILFLLLVPFMKWHREQFGLILIIALGSGVGAFGLMFFALSIAREVAPLAVAMQLGVPFATILSVVFLGERIGVWRVSALVLAFLSPYLAEVALNFGPPEYVLLVALGLITIAYVSHGSFVKGLIAGLLGLAVATVGTDLATAQLRFTFDYSPLSAGFNLIPVLLGLFALPEVIALLENKSDKLVLPKGRLRPKWPTGAHWRMFWPSYLRAASIGTATGALPGAGADIASFLAYACGEEPASGRLLMLFRISSRPLLTDHTLKRDDLKSYAGSGMFRFPKISRKNLRRL